MQSARFNYLEYVIFGGARRKITGVAIAGPGRLPSDRPLEGPGREQA